MATTVAELVWLKGLIEELGVKHDAPATLFCDSQATLQIAANPVFHERTKHIKIDCHFVREKIHKGIVQTFHISSNEQQTDIFTKSLGVAQHNYLISKLGMKDIYHPPT
ncbi:cysteine-rich RLK (RECEPTOR-like protein kinase) 8 [Hibiscus trionum]|uniref:Cysteine-rich RLK (RECEPTOR-like protein kinase) 8 n=1 Tax=Hibiscus trionum TaxID=183268 RepID=A0A9W7IZ16_HIBTR|nr:cysteine-rich RLK (RECEPTOR-like protein kinase) 8 [Hibiscus trionum]